MARFNLKDVRGKQFELGDIVGYMRTSRNSASLCVGQVIGFTSQMVRIQPKETGCSPITRVPSNAVLLERGTLPAAEIDQL